MDAACCLPCEVAYLDCHVRADTLFLSLPRDQQSFSSSHNHRFSPNALLSYRRLAELDNIANIGNMGRRLTFAPPQLWTMAWKTEQAFNMPLCEIWIDE